MQEDEKSIHRVGPYSGNIDRCDSSGKPPVIPEIARRLYRTPALVNRGCSVDSVIPASVARMTQSTATTTGARTCVFTAADTQQMFSIDRAYISVSLQKTQHRRLSAYEASDATAAHSALRSTERCRTPAPNDDSPTYRIIPT